MNECESWIEAWFKRRAGNGALFQASTNYFEAGLIDSLGVMDLVLEAEAHFGIRFNERNFQDRRFATIGGLADIIREIEKGARHGKG